MSKAVFDNQMIFLLQTKQGYINDGDASKLSCWSIEL